MKVFKFGGASVKDAKSIKQVASIIKSLNDQPLLVVVSAMGKTTNALENIVSLFETKGAYLPEIDNLITFHLDIARELFPHQHDLPHKLSQYKTTIIEKLETNKPHDQLYDQVVSLGEIISTTIINNYLNEIGISSEWIDARKFVITDSAFREAKIDWRETEHRMQALSTFSKIIITQGFIGSTSNGVTTTLGREGSDFSAAIFASCLNATSVTIWKDVPGVMSADPKRLPHATTFDELPFREAAEMTYYGATVIHPKTIKPLASKGIPLFVKNFDNVTLPGTKIHDCRVEKILPLIVFKENQCLISCQVTDYSFIDELQIGIIFNALSSRSLKVNLIQNAATSFSFCLDFKEEKVMALIEELGKQFEVYYNTGLTLITIKNYDTQSFEQYRKMKNVILEQSSRSTLQVLIKSIAPEVDD